MAGKSLMLVAGTAGVIGSHLTELLLREGYEARALAQYNSPNSWGWLEDISSIGQVFARCGGIRAPHFSKRVIQGVHTVFCLAALSATPSSYFALDSYVDTNAKGTLNIFRRRLKMAQGVSWVSVVSGLVEKSS